MEIINDGQWISGLDSVSYTLGQGSYQWGQNVVNRGGIIGTRQGFAEVASWADEDPRGLGVITIGAITWLVAAIGKFVYKLNLNSPTGFHKIDNLEFSSNRRMVHFELCVQAQKSVKVGDGYETRNLPTPKFVLIIQDGVADAQYWDGNSAGKIKNHPDFMDAEPTPKGTFMKWAGDRLWVANGRKLRASNLLNPFQFTEELITASGGFFFFLPDNVTGMGVTHDFKSLLVYTNFTTSAFQVGLEDRTAWPNTQDFQRVLFPSIGCASHRTIINMYGMTWWMAHDGWVGLDNTLSAYQTSRLDIQDLNMIRSKAGVSWSQGGGCAGAFGNFLLVSVPSANKWNQHTWVMDQAAVNTIAGASPPVWCANWTGIRPEQWMTCYVGGNQRCFCISRDLTDTGHQSTVWEAFIGQRMDVPKSGAVRKAKDIGCALEARFLGLSPSQYMRLRWIEVDVAEIIGDVKLQVYYCGRRTSYKKIIDTHLTATISNTTEEVFNPDDPLPVYVPQYRTVRSVTDSHLPEDHNTEIQTPYLRFKDREFSVLVQWSGQMAVSAIRLGVDPESDDMEGSEYPDEYLSRRITAEGTGVIGCTLPDPNAPNNQVTSKFMAPMKARWVEFPAYDSAVPNGVFFVAELEATPPPGDYPSNTYPIDVTLRSETPSADFYFTTNGQRPKGPPNPVGDLYPPKPHITLGKTLKAIGVRDGMKPSVILSGQYTQSQVERVACNPPAGSFAPDEFPVTVRLSCPTAEAHIFYVINSSSQPHAVTQGSHPYNPDHPPQVGANKYLHAKAFREFYLPSEETVARYHRVPRCETPTCTPDGGGYPASDYDPTKTITVATATEGAHMRYSINDEDVEHSTHIIESNSGHVEVHPDDVLRVIAMKAELENSLVKTATYTTEIEQVATPDLSPDDVILTGGHHEVDVVVTCTTPNTTLYYEILESGDETRPSHTSPHIDMGSGSATIHIGPPLNNIGHRILRAMCARADMSDSQVAEGTYDHEGGD